MLLSNQSLLDSCSLICNFSEVVYHLYTWGTEAYKNTHQQWTFPHSLCWVLVGPDKLKQGSNFSTCVLSTRIPAVSSLLLSRHWCFSPWAFSEFWDPQQQHTSCLSSPSRCLVSPTWDCSVTNHHYILALLEHRCYLCLLLFPLLPSCSSEL